MGCDAGTNNKKKQTATGVWPKTEFGFSLLNSSLLQNSEKKKKEKMESARELRHRDRVMKKKNVVSHRFCQTMFLPSFTRTTHLRSSKNFRRQAFHKQSSSSEGKGGDK